MTEKLDRYECLKYLGSKLTNELVVLWSAFHEWQSVSPEGRNLPTICMGATVPVGMGLACALPQRKVIVLAGDGDLLMELGALPTLGKENPKNLVVFVNDNEVYAGVGGYATLTAYKTELSAMAKGAGVGHAVTVRKFDEFKREVDEALAKNNGARFIVMKTKDEPYRTIEKSDAIDHVEEKCRFIKHIEEREGVEIFPRSVQIKRQLENK
jgi:TPP-dependent trihydroxycyclohexane-1,2-dione (THcHDO) dehydratase